MDCVQMTWVAAVAGARSSGTVLLGLIKSGKQFDARVLVGKCACGDPMFDAVLQRSTAPRSRLGTGAFLSVLLHAAGLTALLWISTRPEVKEYSKDVSVKFIVPLPPAPPPPPPPPASKRT